MTGVAASFLSLPMLEEIINDMKKHSIDEVEGFLISDRETIAVKKDGEKIVISERAKI